MRPAIKVTDRVRFRTDGEIGEYNRIYGHDKVAPLYVHEVSADGAWVGLDERTVDSKVDLLWQVPSILLDICNDPIEKPAPAFKVGDWVEYSDGTLQQAIIEAYSGQPGEQMVYVWHPQTAHSAKTPLQSITRKLDPSEVKVKVTLAGTVESGASATSFFHLRYGDGVMDWASIDLRHLNPDDRKLVESLLKAQEEK